MVGGAEEQRWRTAWRGAADAAVARATRPALPVVALLQARSSVLLQDKCSQDLLWAGNSLCVPAAKD